MSMLQLALLTFAVAVMPTAGSTVAIPMAITMGMDPLFATALGWAGAVVKVPLAIWLAGSIRMVARRIPWLDRKLTRMEQGVANRIRLFQRWGWPALTLCSAIPAPGFGIWTAAMAGRLLGFPHWSTSLALVSGLAIASTAIMLMTVGVLLPVLTRLLP